MDSTMMFLIVGLCKATPQEFLNPSTSPMEVTIKFPAQAILGFEDVASRLEAAGLLDGDHGQWLEKTINLLCAVGIKHFIENYVLEVTDGLINKGKASQKETERAGGESRPSVQGAHETKGSDRED